jgi:hypothetical protein
MSFEVPVRDDPRPGRRGAWFGLLLAILLSLFYATHFAQHPYYNWDMVAYVAVALIDAGEPAETVHRKTYDIVAASLPPDNFAELTQQGTYRRAVAADAALFAAQLPFYSVKPVYPAVMSLLYRAGMNPVTASVAISAAGYAGICVLLYLWTARWLRPLVAVPLTALLFLCPYLTPIAQFSTPDALSVLVLLAGLFCIIELNRPLSGAAILVGSILVRPENVIYVGVVLAYLLLFRRVAPGGLLILGAAALTTYAAVVTSSHNYGWKTLFYFTFVDNMIDPASFRSPLGLRDYLRIYVQQLDNMVFLGPNGFALFALVGFGAFLLKLGHRPWHDPYFHLIALAAVFMAARTLALPDGAYRMLLASYLMLALALIQACVSLDARYRPPA